VSELGNRILKVDHAGEHGAVSIYSGQILAARLTARSMLAELREFREHERAHRAIFAAELARRGVRRCRSYWFCAIGGFVLGLLTGLCGRSAIAATTVAVERVVLGHLDHQLATLAGSDAAAVEAISSIVRDEREHHDRSALHVESGTWWPRVLTPVVSGSTEAVIRLGMWL
jgi:ubiquinone biosynthesis monooxygenase Coq7